MALGALDTPSEQPAAHEVLLEFPDNRLLIELCGEFDRNLTDIEQKLDVQIVHRGNQLVVIGEDRLRQRAVTVLQSLYERLEGGRTVERDKSLDMNFISIKKHEMGMW